MEEKFFLIQIYRKNGTYNKGVVVHDSINAARQGYHAYLGAYGYGRDPNIDFVQCMVIDMNGNVRDSRVDNRILNSEPTQEA